MLAAIGHTAGAGQRYVSSYCTALVHIGLGDHDAAFASLDRACEERAGYLVYLNVDPAVDPIRNDPRFTNLLHQTKRPQLP
jgi:hypothetical protein